ncbi:MAG TPA: FlgD immunoglobulin-like domain containing protein, partial [Armatimonadota bacterium]
MLHLSWFRCAARCGVALFALLAAVAGMAGGFHPLVFPPVSFTPRPIVVDGKLDDWQGVDGKTYRPLDARLVPGEGTLLSSLRTWDLSATMRWTYDTEALYLAVSWTTPQPPQAQDALTVHLATDRYVNLTVQPAGTRVTLSAQQRSVAAAGAWQAVNIQQVGVRAALQLAPGGYTEELRLPWALVTENGKMPATGAITALLDLCWSPLTPATLKALPVELLRANTHTTLSFLTSQAKLYNAGYMSNPNDWGAFAFLAAPSPVTPVHALDGTTGTTTFAVAQAATAPIIDGKLDEWPVNGFQTAALSAALLGTRYSGALAAQFDAKGLYLAGRFSAAVPLHNLAREAAQMGFGGGDALQVRLYDGKRTVNLCAWYDTQAGKAALTADGKDLPNPFLLTRGAQAAYRADGANAYTCELAIPWSALNLATPQAGDTWKVTFQPWWAGLDAEFTVADTLKLQQRGALALNYTLPADGEVTLGVYDPQGQLVRWLLHGDYRYAGKNNESWDGLDQWGKPLAAGAYHVKGITHAPLTTEYKMSLGNPGTPPWPTADGTGDWLSDESNPQGVATDGKWVYLAAPGCEKGWAIIAVNEQGRRVWGVAEEFYPRAVSLAVSGDYLYALFSGPELTDSSGRYQGKGNAEERAILICLDKYTGKVARFSKEKAQTKVASWPYREEVTKLATLRSAKGYTPGVYGGQPRYFCNDLGESTGALGVAVLNDRVYMAMYYEDKLRVLDALTAKQVDEIPLAKPVGLYAANGTLYAVSGTSVVKVDPATKQATPIITQGLLAPHSLTSDAQGNFYVSDWGASFQVKVFSPAGKLLRAIGKPGGRPWVGKWNANGMLVPRGVAVTADGKLWVAEDDETPKRVSVWDA